MDIKKIRELTSSLSQDEMQRLLAAATRRNPKADMAVLEFLEEMKLPHNEYVFAEEKLLQYWREARKHIATENKYGWVEPSKERDAMEKLMLIDGLVKQYDFPWKIRKKIMEEMYVQYKIDNSCFTSDLRSCIDNMCKTDEERAIFP